jgi:hypothetical protein
MTTRLVSFANSSLSIEYHGARPARIVEFLYRHIPTGASIPPCVTYRLIDSDHTGQLTLYRDVTLLYQGTHEAEVAELLLGDSGYHLAAASRGGLLFHAGALAWGDKGLLLPGAIGAGKTTLTAWLATRGLDYLSDEMVFIPYGSERIQSLTRPLNLKSASRPVLRRYLDIDTRGGQVLSRPQGDLISPELLTPHIRSQETPVALIIFPHYRPAGEFEWQPLSRAQAGLALMECLVNARNLPDHGFHKIARLARTAAAYRMSYTSFEQIGERIGTALKHQAIDKCF